MRKIVSGLILLAALGACAVETVDEGSLPAAPAVTEATLAPVAEAAPVAAPVEVVADPKVAAIAVVGPIIEEQIPGPVGEAMTACIVESASTDELAILAAAATDGVTDPVIALVNELFARDTTIACATAALS